MTVLEEPRLPEVAEPHGAPTGLLAWVTMTDHKVIGKAYMITAFAFFLVGGSMAELIRVQLIQPELDVVDTGTFNELFTMHGTIMLLLFVGPFSIGLANYLVPLQIGARDMAFPRLNALGYWFTLFAGIVMLGGFLTADGAADFGWYGYTPLSDVTRSPNLGGDLWIVGIALLGLAGAAASVNIVTTIITMRAPGMTMFRMPIFTWNMFVVGLLILLAFPVVLTAGFMLFFDRQFDSQIYNAAAGGVPILWQHLFWWFGHPEVYILVLPFFGVFTEIFAVFARRPVFGYRAFVLATIAIGFLSVGVWAHHMFTTGAVLLPFFSGMTMLIAIPTGVKFFNWIGTLWGGKLLWRMPLAWSVAFLLAFLIGGLTGPMLASAPLDFALSDTYFVVAHFHYVLFGGSVLGVFAAVYYWFPKFTGRMLDERWGWVHLIMTFVGLNLTFMVQHVLGLEGMPRRVASYVEEDGFGTLNLVSSIGAFLLGASVLPFFWNVWKSWRHGPPAGDNPWDGQTLEWWTSSPPVPGDYDAPLPPIRSERPVWDANHPDAIARH